MGFLIFDSRNQESEVISNPVATSHLIHKARQEAKGKRQKGFIEISQRWFSEPDLVLEVNSDGKISLSGDENLISWNYSSFTPT